MPGDPNPAPSVPGIAGNPATAPGRFQCQECQKSFGRIEHLTRHSQSHSRERSHKCPRCRKGFYRLDALIRHEKIHDNPDDPPGGKGSRACTACSAGRRKCNRELPCSACAQRSIECIFPSPTKSNAGDAAPSQMRHISSEVEARRIRSSTSPPPWSNAVTSHRERSSGSSASNGNLQYSGGMGMPLTRSLNTDSEPAALISNNVNETNINPSAHQSLWNTTSTDLTSYQDSWHENNFSSINWLPEDWTPAFDLSESMRLDSLSHPGTRLGQPSSSNQIPHGDFSNPPLPETDSRRHWVQSNTPRDSQGSEHSSTPQSQPSIGRLYVDGDGARLPHVRKGLYDYGDSAVQDNDVGDQSDPRGQDGFWFPELQEGQWSVDGATTYEAQISHETYDLIRKAFQSACVASNHFSSYYTSSFPAIGMLREYVHLYFLHFQPIFPFIHAASFSAQTAHWLLVLALSAIGSLFYHGNRNDITQSSVAMLEFLRRALVSFVSLDFCFSSVIRPFFESAVTFKQEEQRQAPGIFLISQVKLLSSIGSMYCGNRHLLEKAKCNHGDLVQFCLVEWSHPEHSIKISPQRNLDQYNKNRTWQDWYQAESRRRTGYCIWLLDCMWAFHFQARPLLSLEDAKVAVPCQEVLWEAELASDWQQLYSVATASISLHSAMTRAYLEKQMQSSMGEFSRILCIHALFRRTWDVETYFQKPLAVWSPTADRQDINIVENSLPLWLPGIPTVSKWRNSACDVLDILHWHANSVIGAASGMEHPTVLHLHLARVVLLTPFREIVQLGQLLAEEHENSSSLEEIVRLKKHVQRWALDDQYKARLAMIHAGVLFWHVRRYSIDAFYEASSVFLATLALWAYGTFAPKTPVNDADVDESPFPSSMQLDRPADDELVQLFVKRGSVMKANITGVGNLCQDKGPGRVLLEGRKILGGLKRWGIRATLMSTLSALIERGFNDRELGKVT